MDGSDVYVLGERPSERGAYSDYRSSHQNADYGDSYLRTFCSGYYAALWSRIERPLVESILKSLAGPDRSCLDFACGTGRVTNVAGPLFGVVVGVDVSQSMLACARVPETVTLVKADLTVSPLPRRFDVVTAFRFFLNAEDTLRKDALLAIHEHLNEGGLLVSNIHMNASSPMGLVYRFLNRCQGRVVRNTLSVQAYRQMLVSNGFAVEQVIGYGYLPRPGWLLPRLCEMLVGPIETISRRAGIPERFAQNFLVVARKR
ncbi:MULTISPECIES: class I SAM-dependent DNA methyltransferase [Mesorhizobium]|uniref:SAM-dependent methyltransferase n=1 Tax=Rhizobium loti TaxID=381 RepID=A0A6M7TWQ3_RHILI|nr:MULTISPECIES: class I SAM-dependent methyltransferase [Mesorhizobium]KRB21209.1 SAM-dependent methyltransferase [Mesorhizobium sp. Root172]OBQ66342.1 SAM-dependent methyltransferase [Mesorhizobium loti]QKC69040.1 class I SAM-dependent methyltransferase [Mesorhizobium loti]